MERDNYKGKMYIPKDTHIRNQRELWPYNRRPNNISRQSSSQYFDNGNSRYHANERNHHYSDTGNINTQFNRHSEHPHDNYKRQYSRPSTDSNLSYSNDRNRQYSIDRNINTQYNRRPERPYDNNRRQYSRPPTDTNFTDSQLYMQNSKRSISPTSVNNSLPSESPLEVKTLELINAVKSQEGIGGRLIFMETDNSSPSTIVQNAVQAIKNGVLSIISGGEPKQPQSYELKINGECIVTGEFMSKQAARNGLCEVALNKFKRTSFFVTKKRNYEEISTEDINKSPQNKLPTTSGMEGSKAHLMMLKMGWGGKGLGINEQGAEKTVAETVTQNITKEGLGGKSIMTEINYILTEFARSAKMTTLAFDAGFTKEERAHIHNLAKKLNLKSKSEGKEENRRITIGKKIERWDLVKELLLTNCENEAFKLEIPLDFQDMWSNQCDSENK